MLIAKDEIFGPVQTILKFKYKCQTKYFLFVDIFLIKLLLMALLCFLGILMR